MSKYDELADSIVKALGGKENITFFTHCTTRLRSSLKDKGLVDTEELKKIKGVIDCRWTGDQIQIIIGTHVADVYDVICDRNNMEKQAAVDENLDVNLTDTKKKRNKFNFYSIIELINAAIAPSLLILVGGGMIKVILILLNMAGLLSADSSTYTVLFNAADAIFYFFPMFVGYGVAKKMGCEPALGVAMGAILVAPQFIANVNAGVGMTIFGMTIYPKAYSSTFLPAILCTAVMCPIYKFFEAKTPKVVRDLVAPTMTFLIMIPVAYLVLAPLASILGDYLAVGVMWLYNRLGFVGVALFAGILPFLITTGMHFCFFPYWGSILSAGGPEMFYLISNCLYNINIGIACIVMGIKTKNVENKSLYTSVGISATVGGVSEPALFGVVLKNKPVLISLIIGNFVSGAVAGLLKVGAYIWPGSWGLFMIPSFIDAGSGLLHCLIAVAVGIVTTAVATFILYKGEKKTA